jgi:hypothetical protein
LAGLTAKQINRAVLGSIKDMEPGKIQGLRRSLEGNTRTMISSLAETARDTVYRENEKIFNGYKYLATLDTRTCLVCAADDGKIFKNLDTAPKLPRHLRDRCLYVPYIKGFEHIAVERAAMNGPVSDKLTYKDWFERQTPEIQKDILGATRFLAYKNGMKIDSFVADGRIMNLAELGLRSPTRENDTAPPKPVSRVDIHYTGLSHDDAMKKEMDYLRTMGQNTGHEHLSFMASNNEIIGTWEGSAHKVNITKSMNNLLNKYPENTVECLHNHSEGSMFSSSDMNTMCRLNKLRRIGLTHPNGESFYLSVGDGDRPSVQTIKLSFDVIYNHEVLKTGKSISTLTRDEENVIISIVNERMRDMFRWDFEEMK